MIPSTLQTSSDIGAVLDARRAHVYSMCGKHQSEIVNSLATSPWRLSMSQRKNKNVLTDQERGLTFCTVAKSGKYYIFIHTLLIDSLLNKTLCNKTLCNKTLCSIECWLLFYKQ